MCSSRPHPARSTSPGRRRRTRRSPARSSPSCATGSRAIGHIIGGLDQQLAARHLLGRRVGLVQVFASGAITGIARSEGAARLVLESLQQRSRIFAAAGGQSFWTGTGGYFTFQIYFL